MQCPRCQTELQKRQGDGVSALCCKGCQGLWLDRAKLANAKQADLPAVTADFWEELDDWQEATISCPDDKSRLRTLSHRGVEVDICPTCSGLWLDKGEWEKLVEARRKNKLRNAGAAAAAIGGVVLLGGATVLQDADNPERKTLVTGNEGNSVVGEVVGDVVDGTVTGLLDGAFSLVGDLFSAIDIF